MASNIPVEKPAQDPVSAGEGSAYTLEALKAHGTRESFWMLLHDKVYDCTAFLDEHPGGDEVMLEEGGKDATEAFEDIGHSDEARAQLDKMLLGPFSGAKSEKAAKKVATAADKASKAASSSSFPLWTAPAALFLAYLAWRILFAA